ncbi:sensor histidine kinase [Olleya sp. YS]|uniref:sensor histidine kinase n=1 Tax=Olleya sp. YS TaxID=3028318 RepID=UPI00243462ED|nr:sensor histidine kinase [Olleya sp. YS]WGD34208.1 sensor histidine kinase [Olleya sp. YS]
MNKSILYLLFFLTVSVLSQSTELYQKTFTKQDGIDIDNIYALCYDNDGFLWLGGSNLDNRSIILSDRKLALQRFNGHSFHSIPLPVFDNPIEKVQQIYKRNDGLFYVETELSDGYKLLLFDPYQSTFKPVTFDGYDQDLTGLSKIYSYNNTDYLLIQKDRTISLRAIASDLTSKEVFNFTSTENKYIMEGSSRIIPFDDFVFITDDNFPVKTFNWNGELIKIIDQVNGADNKNKVVVDEVFKANNKYYAFLFNNPNLFLIDEVNKDFTLVEDNRLPNVHLNTFNDQFDNTLLIASYDGQVTINGFKNQKISKTYQLNLNATDGLKIASKNLNSEVWLATNGQLHYFKLPNKVVKNFLPNYEFRDIKPLDTSNYLVATEQNGWFKINTVKASVTPYNITLDNETISAASRNFIIEDSIIWTNGRTGILRLDTKTKILNSYNHYPITCLEKPNDSLIIYGTNGYHLMQFNIKNKIHKSLLKTDSLDILDIHILKHQNLVVAATNKGLLTYDLKSKKNTFYNLKKDFEDNYLLMVDYHKDYGYLLGSRSGIIYAFNPESKTVTTLYKDDLKAGIATVLFDNDTWWINSFNGIIAYNIKTKSKTRFSEKDGFTHHEANRYSALKTKNGLFVGTLKGLNYFNPSDLKAINDAAALALLKVNLYDKTDKVLKSHYNRSVFDQNNSITLPSENRRLELDFALKNINAVDKGYNYRYRLNDEDWVDLKQQNTLQFANLAAGDYLLEIEALDFSGNKIASSLLLDIHSTEFFYKKWWFFLIVSTSIIGFLLWLLKQAKDRKQLQEQFSQGLIISQENERKRIAKELHDSISQQLTLIKKKAQNTKQEEITVLTHNTLEEVRAISRGLYPPLLKQLGLTESIEQLILDIDEQTELFVTSDIDNIDDYFNENQTLNCYRFVQECVNNILKHANAKALSVVINKQKDKISIKITDNGKGFDIANAQKKNSLGLKTIYERIRILKGEITIDSKSNSGTLIHVIIPIKYV